jgi:hypothetical protein
MVNETIKNYIKVMKETDLNNAIAETKRRLEKNPTSKIEFELLGLLEERHQQII